MNFIVAASTDVGIKKSTNQDSFRLRVLRFGNEKLVFAVLCDGMGGLAMGEVASASLVNAFYKWSEERLPVLYAQGLTDHGIRQEWVEIATVFNEKIKVYGKQCGISLGTTVTVLLLTENRYYIMNIGDTRAYQIDDRVTVLTADQTVVAREVAMGLLAPEQADRDPRRSVLLQCVGASDVVYPDMYFGETKCNAVYMLCTDGFRHEISEQEIHGYMNPNVMTDANGMKANMDVLIELDKQRQEADNITVLAIRTF